MRRAVHNALLALAAGAIAAPAVSADSARIEALLGEQRPDVARWEYSVLGQEPAADAEVKQVGRLGPRTAVRFADGRVRWYSVAGYRDVLVSANAVEGGAEVVQRGARLEERDVIALGCEPLTELPSDTRWRARRRLAAGEVLCAKTIEPAPEVERQHAVTLSARNGGIEVSRVLRATTDARLGERVRLRDAASGITLIGIVTGPGTARLPGEEK